jgi:prepilin-type N-terminal cleavage/methylation domain-containing protein
MKKMFKNEQGFTLLEILVVLTIMGFLIAMVAPRLAGISGGAVDTVCDTNQNRMVTYMSSYFEQTNRFPNKLTNLVAEDTAIAAGTALKYQVPMTSDQDPDNGAEVLAAEINDRNHFHIHILDADEAKELKNMGIVKVFNLNDYSGQNDDGTAFIGDENVNDVANTLVTTANRAPVMEDVSVVEDLGVTMVGCGVPAHAGPAVAFVVASEELGWGEPDWFGRIVLGMGPECSLVTSGVISNAAHCPGGIQNTDNCTYNDYNLVLPRLEATAARMSDAAVGADILSMDHDAAAEGAQLAAISYDDNTPAVTYDYVGNADGYRYREFTITDAQEKWQFATQCPEGHAYPEDDGEYWAVDINNGGDFQ